MLKRITIIFFVLALFLASCQTSTPIEVESTDAQPLSTSTQLEKATDPPKPSSTPAEKLASGDPPPEGCTVISPQPTAGPTEQSLFPPVSEDDWVHGPENANITIIEYGDFQ